MAYWNDIRKDKDPDYGKPWLPADEVTEEIDWTQEEESPLTWEDGTPYERPSDRGNRRPRTKPRPPRERA